MEYLILSVQMIRDRHLDSARAQKPLDRHGLAKEWRERYRVHTDAPSGLEVKHGVERYPIYQERVVGAFKAMLQIFVASNGDSRTARYTTAETSWHASETPHDAAKERVVPRKR
jgi:hypothetical protein